MPTICRAKEFKKMIKNTAFLAKSREKRVFCMMGLKSIDDFNRLTRFQLISDRNPIKSGKIDYN